jgi:hypothetical protein
MSDTLRDIPASAYHADEITDVPTLSSSIVKLLLTASPAHAKAAHPKLNPDLQREAEDKFSLGSAAHSLFLEGITAVSIAPYDNWKTKAAQELKAEARANGQIPMLAGHWDECQAMVESLRRQCDGHPEGPFFTHGAAEQTIVWEDEFGVMCRARLDWLRNDYGAVHDLKTTRASASPDAWSRTALSIGADIQAALYLRGCRAVFGGEADFRFIVVETTPPYALSVFTLAPDALALAEKKLSWAMKTWAMCLRNDDWPAYPQRVAHIEAPPWVEAQWLERELREVMA